MTRDLPADTRKRQRTPRSVKVARYLVVAWSNGSVEVDPAWQLVDENDTREIELLEAEMVESITSSHKRCPTARSSASSSKCSDLQQTAVEFGADGPLKADLDEQGGRWLLQGSQWLGRRVGRTFQAHNEHGLPSGLPIVSIGRVVAYKPARRGYAAVRCVSVCFVLVVHVPLVRVRLCHWPLLRCTLDLDDHPR